MEYLTPPEQQKKAPPMLIVLAVLTFIGSGLNALIWFFLSFSSEYIPVMIEIAKNMSLSEDMVRAYEQLEAIAGWKFLILALIYALAVIGAALMLKLKKLGFHFYIISQILLFCCCNFIIGGDFKMDITGIIGSLMFILLYGTFYKFMDGPDKMEIEDDTTHIEEL